MTSVKNTETFPYKKIIVSGLAATVLGIVLVAVFSFVLQKQWLEVDTIPYVNAGIKLICSIAAAALAVARTENRTVVAGAISALVYMTVSFIVFSLISRSFSFNTSLLFDFSISLLTGCIAGIIKNLRN